jgi:hypothetical protein
MMEISRTESARQCVCNFSKFNAVGKLLDRACKAYPVLLTCILDVDKHLTNLVRAERPFKLSPTLHLKSQAQF